MLRRTFEAIPFRQPAFEMTRRWVRLPKRVYQHLYFEGVVNIPVEAGRAFTIRHHGYQVENDLFWAGYGNGWEATSLRLWARLSQHARTIFDIGANTGVYSLAAKAVNPKARVFAFEPVDRIALRLSENVALNGYDIEVVVAGVSQTTGEAVFYEPGTEHAYSASLNPEMLAGMAGLVEKKINVIRMDDFAAARALPSVDLFKIDAEKHEIEVLSGFGDLIQRHRPVFLLEVLDRSMGEKVERIFTGLDYAFYEIAEGQEVRRVNSLGGAPGNCLICSKQFAATAGLKEGLSHRSLYSASMFAALVNDA
jgi:FkbM family methyltransferase